MGIERISLAPWPTHPGAMEISVGPGGVQLPPHQSPQWLPRRTRTPVRVVVLELLIAVQVYVLSTPVVSDGLVDDRTSLSSPSDEVVACVAGGAT
jgi:hypothetical protein